ncbi:ankyrin repeat domain-containing protein [Planococcus salinus]|uniref:Ankyrin repeat domain-containing protein n=1 Tax=Planococcus salinus TaxID=1848460 RepID=A0A3M8P594_9BACL|nr:ankyrin repeat domain-containing protein [Planococcus salinus]RNF38782.1 ankyrin repeat domain-containing protein [Planococcus salinus]
MGIFKKFNAGVVAGCVIMLAGCDIEININSSKEAEEKENAGQEMESAKPQKASLEQEISINGIGLYDSVESVEDEFGIPSDEMEEAGSYSYEYQGLGISFGFDKETDEVNAIMVESGIAKTGKGVMLADEYDEVIKRYSAFNVEAFNNRSVVVHDDRHFLAFNFDQDSEVVLFSLMDTKFYEKETGMSLDDFIGEMERISRSPVMGVGQETVEYEQEQPEKFYEVAEEEQEWEAPEEQVTELASSADTTVSYATEVEEMHLYAALIDGKPSRALELLDDYQYDLNYLFSPSGHPSPYFQTTFLHAAAEYSTLEVVQEMVEQGADPDTLNPDGYPVLFTAIRNNKTDIAEHLLDWGADPGYVGYDTSERSMSNSATPLMLAAERGNVPLIEDLVYRGVDVDQQNEVGETALMFAVYHDRLNAAQTLVAFGADTQVRDNTHAHTIFDIPADEWGLSGEMVEWLGSLGSELN